MEFYGGFTTNTRMCLNTPPLNVHSFVFYVSETAKKKKHKIESKINHLDCTTHVQNTIRYYLLLANELLRK